MSQGVNPQPAQTAAPLPRSAKEVIDAAIQENRRWEYVCLGLVVLFAGVGVISLGAVQGNALVALAGSVGGALFWPALRYAVSIRRANIAIRLLEVPLNHAKTAQQAAEAIREAFISHFAKDKSDVVPKL